MLLQNYILNVIFKKFVKNYAGLFLEIAVNKQDYKKFYDIFSKNIKILLDLNNSQKSK